jgi:hypothetical protein
MKKIDINAFISGGKGKLPGEKGKEKTTNTLKESVRARAVHKPEFG